jgi:hypothetical protein
MPPDKKLQTVPTEIQMKTAKKGQPAEAAGKETPSLEVRYGKIGISAVVAAMRYRSEARDAQQASTGNRPDERQPQKLPEFAA